ncbi:DNA-directed RNA polymerase II subunit RPB11 [Phanerochaete sordida]|uniref:DNA-directed RNA polymerase II subunit RPB11 n=1 Tax=Phanerochaete sordida TaxID=48140 RepID=A0A9P3FZ29_9APHY|nr:DNA-directed RNA polymerase II subunit RPB11 [Phanerochaete sordida]
MNAPNRFELFVLDEGEKLVEISEDTKIPNAATFKIVKEDHTLGNLLRAELLNDSRCLFAGYKVPHPLHPYFQLKVQTDGSVTPSQIVTETCQSLLEKLASVEAKFKREFTFVDVDGAPKDMGPYGAVDPTSWEGGKDYLDL